MIRVFALSVSGFFEKIDKMFFTPEFGKYEHLGFLGNSDSFKWAILALYFGLVIASVLTYYNRNVLGKAVRALDTAGSPSPEGAKTLAELGLGKNIFIKLSLRKGGTLAGLIRRVAAEKGENDARMGGKPEKKPKDKVDFESDRFYLAPEKRDSLIQRFSAKGNGILSIVLVAVLGLIAVVVIFKVAPFAFGLLDSALGGFSQKGSGAS